MLEDIKKRSVVWLLLLVVLPACRPARLKTQRVRAHYYLMDSLAAVDSVMDDEIKPYRDSITQKMNKVIGVARRELSGGLPEGLLSNFVSDLILEECRLGSDSAAKPDVGIINVKGLRVALQQGNITVGNIYQLMPFENEIVYLTLSESQLKELFNYMAGIGGEGISGASFGIRNKRAVNIKVGGKPLEERNYIVATSDYLADGGDHFVIFKSAIVRQSTNLKVRDAIIQHIRRLTANNQIIDSQLDKRIYNADK